MSREKELKSALEETRDRLESSQRAWTAMRRELDDHKAHRAMQADREILITAAEEQARAFKDGKWS